MNVGTISKRYAEALYEYAKELNAEDAVYRNMQQLCDVLRNLKNIPAILGNPSLTLAERVQLICELVKEPSPVLERFALLVAKANREEYLLYMAYAYMDIYRADKRIVPVKITTAVPLDKKLQEKIESILQKDGNVTVEMKNVVDESLVGGFVCEADNTRFDASVKKQLAEIKKQLLKTNRKIV